jgi:hypothetical protein
MKLYHGTLKDFKEDIVADGQLNFGDGIYGKVGIFLTKRPEGTRQWIRYNYNNYYGNKSNAPDLPDVSVLLEIDIPKDHLKYITPDFNLEGDVFCEDPETGEEIEVYTSERDWRHPCVEEVIYNNCKKGDSFWEEWVKEYGDKVDYEVEMGGYDPYKIPEGKENKEMCGIPIEWVRECVETEDSWCGKTRSL